MGSFNNTGISGLWIGGKSVRRASLGGKVFFEKHDYDFSLTSDKSILSHADNESATLTATLTDYNEPLPDEPVIFSAESVKTKTVNTSGTYDFGYNFEIDYTNLSTDGSKIIIGNPNGKCIQVFCSGGTKTIYVKTPGESVVSYTRTLTNNVVSIKNGILTANCVSENLTLNLKTLNIDLTQWTLEENAGSATITQYTYLLLKTDLSTGIIDAGNEYSISNFYTNDTVSQIILGQGSSVIQINGSYINAYVNQSPLLDDNLLLDSTISVENGYLTYMDSLGVEQTVDVSSISNLNQVTVQTFNEPPILESTIISKSTDNDGQCSVGYVSKGAGDLNIKVECMNLQETYGISDCTIARPTEQSLTGTSSTKVHSLNIDSIGDLSNTNFELAFKFKMTQDYGGVLSIGASNEWSTSPTKANYRLSLGSDSQSGTKKRYAGVRTTSTNDVYGSAISSNTYYDCKIVRNGNDVSFYFDGTSFSSKTQSFFEDYSDFSIYGITWRYCSIAVKDITLKPL